MSEPLVSIIIPVYNVEKYITKCIQSVLDQTYKNFEAIIVDDGSPDNSIRIAKALVGNDPRFVFLKKENGGLSSARNFGLDHTTGDYIAFLDSDDYLAADCFEQNINLFKDNPELEITIFGLYHVDENGAILSEHISNVDKYYQTQDYLLENKSIDVMACNKIYHKNVWENLRFVENIIYEDKEIMLKILYNRKITLLRSNLYFYTQRVGSIIHTYNKNALSSILYIGNSHKTFLYDNGIYDSNKEKYRNFYIRYCLFQPSMYLANYSDNYLQDSQWLLNNLDSDLISIKQIMAYASFSSLRFWMIMTFKMSPQLFKFIFRIFNKLSQKN